MEERKRRQCRFNRGAQLARGAGHWSREPPLSGVFAAFVGSFVGN